MTRRRWFVAALAMLPFLLTLQPVAATPATFAFNWSGTAGSPTPWAPGPVDGWDLIVHNRDNQQAMNSVAAQHGADCSAFPNRHTVTAFADMAFICNNHMMTALNGGGYSEIEFTPNQLIDFSTTATITVAISTLKDNDRDWLDFWITPFNSNLVTPSIGIAPDLQGPPAEALVLNEESAIPTTAHLYEFHNCATAASCLVTDQNGTGADIESCVAPLGGVSASRRDVRRLTLTPTRITYSVIVNGVPCVLLDDPSTSIGTTTALVQFGHHSYAPDEGTACNYAGCVLVPVCPQPGGGCVAGNTWHWSDVAMSPVVPFTMLRGDMPIAGIQATSPSQRVNFSAPSPTNAFLRFSGLAARGSIRLTLSNGATIPAVEQVQKGDGIDGVSDGSFISYWTPIPAGTTYVTFAARDPAAACCPWTIQDVSIWSR